MTVRVAWLLVLLVVSAAALTGCASTGNPPRPRPFPGAEPPAAPAPSAPSAPEASRSPVIATALALRGVPYRNGGSEPTGGFDCSGFVQWVYAQHGTRLPRETREQYREGGKVDRDDIRPGDLVFFETVARGASHVGIALGGGEFVHAPSSRGVVRVERYTSGYWASRWVGARRLMRSG